MSPIAFCSRLSSQASISSSVAGWNPRIQLWETVISPLGDMVYMGLSRSTFSAVCSRNLSGISGLSSAIHDMGEDPGLLIFWPVAELH